MCHIRSTAVPDVTIIDPVILPTPRTRRLLPPQCRCRATLARIRQSRPHSGLRFHVKSDQTLQVIPSGFGRVGLLIARGEEVYLPQTRFDSVPNCSSAAVILCDLNISRRWVPSKIGKFRIDGSLGVHARQNLPVQGFVSRSDKAGSRRGGAP